MKVPRYAVLTMQDQINCGLNAFAFQLLAESFGDIPEKFGDENVVFLAHAHNGQEVWFIMTKKRPELSDFDADRPDRAPLPQADVSPTKKESK